MKEEKIEELFLELITEEIDNLNIELSTLLNRKEIEEIDKKDIKFIDRQIKELDEEINELKSLLEWITSS